MFFMDIREAIKNRRSIRKFLTKHVSEETIHELIADSLWAPSWGNTQPWEFMVITGPALERFKEENKNALLSGKKPSPEIQMPQKWPDAMKARYVDVGRSVLEAQAIARKDLDGRLKYYGNMFSLFGAPALLLVLLDKSLLIEYAMLDIGLFLQSFMLLTTNEGLGSIVLSASVNYPDILRERFPIPEDKRIVIGVAIGWPDWDAPVNQFERRRAAFDESGIWIK
jgi:nitroreductase